MRIDHYIKHCDNDECKKVLVDTREDVRLEIFYATFDERKWGIINTNGNRMNAGMADNQRLFCSEECLVTYIRKFFANIKMVTLKK